MNYYNEYDKKTAAWLRELIRAGAIPDGIVDERSIAEVKPSDLTGFTQCHFFAGIGGWSLALQLAGWPADRPVWTGSCPCQPFSVAGRGKGVDDERHLWPVFAELIRACKPPTVFGEQVASKAGRDWIAGVFADLEGMGYQRAGADLCAAGVGAPHIRQRLYWVAHSGSTACKRDSRSIFGEEKKSSRERQQDGNLSFRPANGSNPLFSGLSDAKHLQCEGGISIPRTDCGPEGIRQTAEFAGYCETSGLGNADLSGCIKQCGQESVQSPFKSSQRGSIWSGYYHECRDGKTRRIPVEPALFPLVNGVSHARMGILRGAGNAIVPQVAAEFVAAFCEC